MLPSFLHPFSSQDTPSAPFQSAQFIHSGALGSSHALWWPPRSSDSEPDALLLFIPGNPGLADFYIPFLSSLHEKHVSSNLAIVAHAHLDHSPAIINRVGTRYLPEHSLTIQVQSSVELLDAASRSYSGKTRIIVVGHSVGAWIALQMLKARPNGISAVFLLFPTISNIASTPNGKLLSPIFLPLSRSVLSSLSFLTGYLPGYFFTLLYSNWPAQQLRVLQEFLLSSTSITAALSMAHCEMKTIRELDSVLLGQHKQRLYFYYAPRDDWVGEERNALLRILDPDGQSLNIVRGPSDVPHAFCISES
ncbi:hypothetical protein GALMADRAFT_52315 [Galerina marginata CBS 339.88]|uniref:AB hydrolase-1 domain-containing protein n=1 Tax=Galerina marginata (strain CBS 339.88) TaxID=685588 RepID=A0A067U1Y3_GALM3|nr:hypothetical protein GALMADRAFT_52315 [Galerina marginata CBS 339.88]